MRFSNDNFLYNIKQIVTGKNGDDAPVIGSLIPSNNSANVASSAQSADGGIKMDTPYDLSDLQLLGAGNAIVAEETHAFALKVAATIPTIGTLQFVTPRDYDEASDHLILRVQAAQISIATDNNVKLQAVVYTKAPGAALSAGTAVLVGTAPFSTVATVLSTATQVIEINASGLGLTRDTLVYLAIATNGNNATAGNEVELFSLQVQYDSCIVSFNETDATQNPSTSGLPGVTGFIQPGFGNPLR